YPIDLIDVLRLAGANNLTIAYFTERIREAKAKEGEAAIWYLPDLSAGPSYTRHNGRIQSTEGNILDVSKASQFSGATIELSLDPLAGIYEKLVAHQMRIASEAAYHRSVIETLNHAAAGYYDLVRALKMTVIAKDAVTRSEELLRLSERLAEGGAGLEADVARSKAQLAQDRQELLRSQQDAAVAGSQLALTLHLDPAVTLHVKDEVIRAIQLADESQSLETLYDDALANRPEIMEAKARKQAAESSEKAARWGPLTPELVAAADFGAFGGGTGGRLRSYSDRTDLAILLRWRLEGMGLADRKQYLAARSKRRQAGIRVSQVEDQIRAELVETKRTLQTLSRQIDTSDQQIKAATESLRLTEARFKGGAGLQLEVLQAQQAFTQAQGNRLTAIVEYNKAQHSLIRLLGRTPLPKSPPRPAGGTNP
ncbi:MAG: TolC family protein, partial [Opitutales bacterium]